MNEYFMAAIRHHLEAVRLSEEDPDIPPADKEPLQLSNDPQTHTFTHRGDQTHYRHCS